MPSLPVEYVFLLFLLFVYLYSMSHKLNSSLKTGSTCTCRAPQRPHSKYYSCHAWLRLCSRYLNEVGHHPKARHLSCILTLVHPKAVLKSSPPRLVCLPALQLVTIPDSSRVPNHDAQWCRWLIYGQEVRQRTKPPIMQKILLPLFDLSYVDCSHLTSPMVGGKSTADFAIARCHTSRSSIKLQVPLKFDAGTSITTGGIDGLAYSKVA